MDKLKLRKPIEINGKEYKELPYDLDGLTAKDKMNAGKKYKASGGIVSVQELDPDYHLHLFAAAVEKADPSIDTEDVLRMSARDSAQAEKLVRDFFFLGSEDSLQTDT